MCSKWLLTKMGGQGHFLPRSWKQRKQRKVVTWFSAGTGVHSGRRMVVSMTCKPELWLRWTSWACENCMFHLFCVFSGISTLSFQVLKRGLHAVANHRSVNVRSMVLRLWYSITVFHPDFLSNHGNDNLGYCFSRLPGLLFAVWPRLI